MWKPVGIPILLGMAAFGIATYINYQRSCDRLAEVCAKAEREMHLHIITQCHVGAFMRAGDDSVLACRKQLSAMQRVNGQ